MILPPSPRDHQHSASPAERASTRDPLQPRDGALWCVRWYTLGRGDMKHRYYRRSADAADFRDKLHGFGRDASVFRTETTWREVY